MVAGPHIVYDVVCENIFTACKRSCGKVMFFTGVCDSGSRREGSLVPGGLPGPGGVPDPRGVPGLGVPAPGGCLVQGVPDPRGVPGPGGACSQVVVWCGGCLVPGECLVETPRTATAAGGTHPTGMHSC